MQKPSKRDLQWSEKSLHAFEEKYMMYSNKKEADKFDIIKIDNTNLNPGQVSEMIINEFNLFRKQ